MVDDIAVIKEKGEYTLYRYRGLINTSSGLKQSITHSGLDIVITRIPTTYETEDGLIEKDTYECEAYRNNQKILKIDYNG